MEGKTFRLEQLDEKFWGDVILATLYHSSGLGGAGSLSLVTTEGKEYFITFDSFPYSEYHLEEFHSLFRKCDTWEGARHPYMAERNGWTYFRNKHLASVGGHALIRDDYYDAFMQAYQSEACEKTLGFSIIYAPSVMGYALGWNADPERFVEETAYLKHLEEEIERRAEQARRDSIKLTDQHFDWKPLYPNNYKGNGQFGEYALLFKEADDKVIGYRFSIVYQREELSPLCYQGMNSRIERYNLFEDRLDDVQGPLHFPPDDIISESLFEIGCTYDLQNTINTDYANTFGEFVRSFATAEEAKQYAMDVANIRHYADTENLITDPDNPERIHRNWLRKYEGILAFRKHYKEILEVVCNYIYPSKSMGGGGHISAAIQEKLHLDESLIREIWKYIPLSLCQRTQEKAERIIGECHAFLGIGKEDEDAEK